MDVRATKQARQIAGHTRLQRALSEHINLDGPGTDSLAAWFLGPKAENQEYLLQFVQQAVNEHCEFRKAYFPDDPPFVTEKVKQSGEFQDTIRFFQEELSKLLNTLKGSVPLASYRNQSHMYWDITMPGAVGYFGAMLYNQNNVAAEASPITTYLEMQVGDELCKMLGYEVAEIDQDAKRPWGHITCDGSVANLESMWMARNLKYYPVSIAEALKQEEQLEPAKNMTVPLPAGGRAILTELDSWQLLNLTVDAVLDLSLRLQQDYGIDSEQLTQILNAYSVQSLGLCEFYRRFLAELPYQLPAILAPSTMHYSWPKGAAILGLGIDAVERIGVDLDARMDISRLRQKLDECLAQRRPVMQVVAVMGSTEESAVDPLSDIVALRNEFRQAGLEFELHLDAAWGGYFCTMLRGSDIDGNRDFGTGHITPDMPMGDYEIQQYQHFPQADSITVDPHKGGYIPYPAGALCYRDSAMRYLVSFTAPVVYHGGVDPTVGVYGVEGSKPGAAAAGVYLSHRVIRPDRSGYGKILGKCTWNSKRLYCQIVTMAKEKDPFIVVPVQHLPAEKNAITPEPYNWPNQPQYVRDQLQYIEDNFVTPSNDELFTTLSNDQQAFDLFRELGSDQIIITYSFNFKKDDGTLNADADLHALLNQHIFEQLSLHPPSGIDAIKPDDIPTIPMIVTSSSFSPTDYGQPFVNAYKQRLGLEANTEDAVAFIISTTQDPWVTDTEKGNWLPEIIEAMHGVVTRVVDCLKQSIDSDGFYNDETYQACIGKKREA